MPAPRPMPARCSRVIWLVLWSIAAAIPTARAAPGDNVPGAPPARPGAMIDRLRGALKELDLNDEQRQKVKALIDQTVVKLRDLTAEPADNNGGPRRAKVQEVMQGMRQQLGQILTSEQQLALREKMQQADGAGPGRRSANNRPDDKPASRPAAEAPPKMADTMMMDAPAKPEVVRPKAPTVAAEDANPAKPIEPGQTAPDLRVKKFDGSPLQFSVMSGRVVVLVFGSYTDPIFRSRAASIQKLYEDLGTRASMFLVYTKEAHPVGGWELEKNKEQNIFVTQPINFAARQAAARQCRDALHLTMPIIIDELDDACTKAYGGFPNAAVVIARDGTIAASQQWVETTALRRAVDAAIAREHKPVAK